MNIEDDFEIIENEVLYLHLLRKVGSDFFEQEQSEVLNTVGGSAWYVIANAIKDAIILALTRLVTDRDSKTYGPKATLQRVIDQADGSTTIAMTEELEQLRKLLKNMKTHRDSRIAHLDRVVAHGGNLPTVTLVDIDNALDGLRNFMNNVRQLQDKNVMLYNDIWSPHSGRYVLRCITDGLLLQRLRDDALTGQKSAKDIFEELLATGARG